MSKSPFLEALPVKRLGRYQLRLRTFLCLPFVVALVWWLAGPALDLKASFIETLQRRWDIQDAISLHEQQAMKCQANAEAEIPAQETGLALVRGRGCQQVTYRLSESEIEYRKTLRQHAALCVVYNLSMKQKYESAYWTPWGTIPPDPSPPSIPRRDYSERLLHGE
jgi:hypothetical protein